MTTLRGWILSLFSIAPMLPTAEVQASRRRLAAEARWHASVARRVGDVAERTPDRVAMPEHVARGVEELRSLMSEVARRADP